MEEFAAPVFLQLPDLVAHSRRADEQLFSCIFEAQMSRSRFKGAQSCEGQSSCRNGQVHGPMDKDLAIYSVCKSRLSMPL